MGYSYVIVDDDSKSMLKTKSVMDQFSQFTLLGTASTYDEGMDLIVDQTPDFVLLEAAPKNPKSNLSLHLINALQRYLDKLPQFIIVSQCESQAVAAIQHEVWDYLLKPVTAIALKKTFLRFEKKSSLQPGSISKGVSKNPASPSGTIGQGANEPVFSETLWTLLFKELEDVKKSLSHLKTNTTTLSPLQIQDEFINTINTSIQAQLQNRSRVLKAKRDIICIKSYGDYRFLELETIAFLKADNNSTDITLKNGEQLTAFKTLKYFEENLPSNFYRIHNSYMVNIDYVARIHTGNSVCYIKDSKHQIPYSKGFKANIERILVDLVGLECRDS